MRVALIAPVGRWSSSSPGIYGPSDNVEPILAPMTEEAGHIHSFGRKRYGEVQRLPFAIVKYSYGKYSLEELRFTSFSVIPYQPGEEKSE